MITNTKRLILAALLALFGALPLMALPQVGESAPDFTLKTLDGEHEYTLSALKGKVVYLDFWASWCSPCRKAFPEVMELHEQYKEQGLEVLAISLDQAPGPAKKFIAQQKSLFPALFDAQKTAAVKYGIRSIPSTVIVDAEGKVAFTMIGFDPRKVGQIHELLDGLLEHAEPAAKATEAM
jgi:thiol-disulfide isomerase/thioredoxin